MLHHIAAGPDRDPLTPRTTGKPLSLVRPVMVGERSVYRHAGCPVGCTACGPQMVPRCVVIMSAAIGCLEGAQPGDPAGLGGQCLGGVALGGPPVAQDGV